MVKKKTCVFISGQGTNLKNLILYSRNNNFPIKISLIVSNNSKAYGLNYAKKFKIPLVLVDTKKRNYENKILLNLKKFNISFICLAGYMKIISNKLIKEYKNRIINVHPSLLPKYKGLNTFAKMYLSFRIHCSQDSINSLRQLSVSTEIWSWDKFSRV